jgi:hypothetical protein
MHVALSRNEMHQNFITWVYEDEKLVRGSGLFVGETGVAANHHFLAPKDGCRPILLFSQALEISREIGALFEDPYTGLYFDRGPDSSRYLPHTDQRQPDDQFLRRQGYERSQSGSREAL